MTEQKLCPFCGSSEVQAKELTDRCRFCGAEAGHSKDGTPNWCNRPIEDALRAELEASRALAERACKRMDLAITDSLRAGFKQYDLRAELEELREAVEWLYSGGEYRSVMWGWVCHKSGNSRSDALLEAYRRPKG